MTRRLRHDADGEAGRRRHLRTERMGPYGQQATGGTGGVGRRDRGERARRTLPRSHAARVTANEGVSIDIDTLDHNGPSGAIWSLPHSGDLDANVVVLHAGDEVGQHVNDEVDVLIVGIDGQGTVIVDGDQLPLHAGRLVYVVKHAARSITAD